MVYVLDTDDEVKDGIDTLIQQHTRKEIDENDIVTCIEDNMHNIQQLSPEVLTYALVQAAKQGLGRAVQRLLHFNVDYKRASDAEVPTLLAARCIYDCEEVLLQLLNHSDIDPSVKQNRLCTIVASRGFQRVMTALLLDNRVSPDDNHNYALYFASRVGHQPIIDLLLADGRVNAQYLAWVPGCGLPAPGTKPHFHMFPV
jgi:hypothetical protein